jgi:hypothetical protein
VIYWIASACIAACSLALAGGFLIGDLPAPAAALLAFGAFWLAAKRIRWAWVSTLGLILTAAAAGGGLLLGLPASWLLPGALGGLLAWDLAAFEGRLRLADPADDLAGLERRHLAWLLPTAAVGLLLSSAAATFRMQISFGWLLLLALIAAVGLMRLVSWLFRS